MPVTGRGEEQALTTGNEERMWPRDFLKILIRKVSFIKYIDLVS